MVKFFFSELFNKQTKYEKILKQTFKNILNSHSEIDNSNTVTFY